ncbi:hypothetical protein NM688_g3226 [Phlebia brevispora]|uniref:Uncharacterized protein n=1 Tax=Phlebia brevispora TaxID=194682 RepID=A0ACC1T6H3_9APHY|nr:hypothetical protein NM688_g3226 [Phlebia brevispora]
MVLFLLAVCWDVDTGDTSEGPHYESFMRGKSAAVGTEKIQRIVASKKRAKRGQVKEVVFDETARREFLTGFHKRKVEKKEIAKKKAEERERQERLEARREKRLMLAEKAAKNVAEVERAYGAHASEDEEEEWDGFGPGSGADRKGKAKESAEDHVMEEEYEDEQQLAVVTVVEDFDPEELLHGPTHSRKDIEEGQDQDEDGEGAPPPAKRVKVAEMKQVKTQSKVATKAKDVKYQTNAARKAERTKQIKRKKEKAHRAGGKDARKGKGTRGRR